MSTASDLLLEVAGIVQGLRAAGVRRVAIDGVDGAGKTEFADRLAGELTSRGVGVIRASVDDFHRPALERHRLGRDSPEGFYRESYDYDSLRTCLLQPLADHEPYCVAVFDVARDCPLAKDFQAADESSVLILDGIFLHRPELREEWDLSIFLEVPFDTSYARMAVRDGSSPDPDSTHNRRYRDGQLLYFAEADPRSRADLVIDYADFDAPTIVRR